MQSVCRLPLGGAGIGLSLKRWGGGKEKGGGGGVRTALCNGIGFHLPCRSGKKNILGGKKERKKGGKKKKKKKKKGGVAFAARS